MALDNLDPSIPLAAGQIPQHFQQGMLAPAQQQNAMLQMQMRMQQLRQLQQSENALRQLYSPGNLDKSGRPTANAMGQFMQVDPNAGMKLQNQFAQMDEHKLRTEALRGQVTEEHRKTGYEIGTDVLSTYETALKDTGDPKLANQRAQDRRAELVDQACKDGSLPGACQKTFMPWDPIKYRAAKSSYEAANTKPMTSYQAQELGIQRGRLGLEAEKFQTETKHQEDTLAETAQHHRKGEDKETGWQILTDPTKKDASGNPIQYRYNPNSARATTLSGQPYEPGGAQKVSTTTEGEGLSEDAIKYWGRRVWLGDPIPPMYRELAITQEDF